MKLRSLTRAAAAATLLTAAGMASAAPVAVDCSAFVNATLAGGVCTSAGKVGNGVESVGVGATVSATGSSNLLTYGGFAVTPLFNNDIVLGSGEMIQYSTGILSGSYYLIYIFETGGNLNTRDFVVESVLGANLIAGMTYTEGTGQGTVKWSLYADPTNGGGGGTGVPEPGTLALAGLALAGVGLARRRAAKR